MNKHQTLGQDGDVANITTAHTSHSDDMRSRMIKYAIAMGIRMVCLVLVFVLDGWWKIVPIIGAVFLPWIAVVIANGGGDTSDPNENALLDHAPQAELSEPDLAPAEEPVILQGEVIPDDDGPVSGTSQAKGSAQ